MKKLRFLETIDGPYGEPIWQSGFQYDVVFESDTLYLLHHEKYEEKFAIPKSYLGSTFEEVNEP